MSTPKSDKRISQEIERLQREVDKLKRKVEDLKKENENLKKEFAAYQKEHPAFAPPPFFKPNVTGERKRPGAPKNHKGVSRHIPNPEDVTDEIVLTTDKCPHCGGHVEQPDGCDVRYVWDIPPPQPRIIKVITKRPFCRRCGKRIVPSSLNIFPSKRWGIGIAVTVLMWKMMGISREKMCFMLEQFYGIRFSEKTIQDIERFVAEHLKDIHAAIGERVRKAKAIHGDETGHRVDGKNHWLWVFSSDDAAYFSVDRSRGRGVPTRFLNDGGEGVLVNDGWNAYNSVERPRQQCLVHVNRQLQRIETICGIEPRHLTKEEPPAFVRKGRPRQEFLDFADGLRAILRDAIEFVKGRPGPDEREDAYRILVRRLDRLLGKDYKDPHVLRKVKFLRTHRDEMFTFVRVPGVPWHNNQAERDLRPSVVIRKVTYGSRSEEGSKAFEVIMSIFMTCKKRGQNFLEFLRMELGKRMMASSAAKS